MRHSTRNSQLCLRGDACLLQKQAAREAGISENESVFDENLKKDSAAQAAFRTVAWAAAWNIFGLALTHIGVLILYWFGMPCGSTLGRVDGFDQDEAADECEE